MRDWDIKRHTLNRSRVIIVASSSSCRRHCVIVVIVSSLSLCQCHHHHRVVVVVVTSSSLCHHCHVVVVIVIVIVIVIVVVVMSLLSCCCHSEEGKWTRVCASETRLTAYPASNECMFNGGINMLILASDDAPEPDWLVTGGNTLWMEFSPWCDAMCKYWVARRVGRKPFKFYTWGRLL